MALMGAKSVVGVDVSESGLAGRCRRAPSGWAIRMSPSSRPRRSNCRFADAEFDFVCCSGVLHHTRGVEQGLREIHRVLKPGGSMYLLLYGAGGVFWPLNYLLRPFATLVGPEPIST